MLVIVSVPFAARQTENLTGGGFETKGTGSRAVSHALAGDFPGIQAEDLSIVFDNRKGDPQALAAAIDRVQRDGFKDVDHVPLNPRALAAARASTEDVVVMPLVVSGSRDETVDAASTIRENLDIDKDRPRRCRCTWWARARCGPGCSSCPRRTSSRPRGSACRSC